MLTNHLPQAVRNAVRFGCPPSPRAVRLANVLRGQPRQSETGDQGDRPSLASDGSQRAGPDCANTKASNRCDAPEPHGRDWPRDGQARQPRCDRRLLAGRQHHVPDERSAIIRSDGRGSGNMTPCSRITGTKRYGSPQIVSRRGAGGASHLSLSPVAALHPSGPALTAASMASDTRPSCPARRLGLHRDARDLVEQVRARRQIGMPLRKDGEVDPAAGFVPVERLLSPSSRLDRWPRA